MPALRNAIAMSVVLRALGPEPHDVLTMRNMEVMTWTWILTQGTML